MKRSGDSTRYCRSPTPTLNSCDLTPSIRTQSSEQEYSYLTASKRHPSTPHSRNTPQSFHEEPGRIFSRGRQKMCTSLACSQAFSKIFWRVEICSVVLRPRQKSHWVSSSFGSLFSRHLGIYSSWEAKQRDALVVGSFIPVSLFVDGHDQFANLSVSFQNATPLDTHESAKPCGVLSSLISLSNFTQLALSSYSTAASESLLMHSSTEAFICA